MMRRSSTLSRIAIILACIGSLTSLFSVTCGIVALSIGGRAVLPIVMPSFMLNMLMAGVNLTTITLCSPDHDPLHYPRRFIGWIRTYRRCRSERRAEHRAERNADKIRRSDPVHLAWDAIVSPPHAITDARRSRLEDLRFRADIAVDRLGGSLDIGDIDTIVLMQKTLGEVSAAYRAALTVATTDKGRKAIDRSLEETLEKMVSAAESRLAVSDRAVTDRFDAAIRHAQASSDRLADR